MIIRPLIPEDWSRVREIYAQGIATGDATFETSIPEWESWDRQHVKSCRLVAQEDAGILGWAALSSVSDRCVYGGVAEVSVYVAEDARGRGLGSTLLTTLVEASEEAGFWTLQAGIFPENLASIRMHEKVGFRVVGTREALGRMSGRWRDVVFLERRSRRVGVE